MESLKELNREIREYTGTGEKTFKDFSKYRANVMFEVAKKIEKAEGYDCLMSVDRGKLKEEANKYRSKHGKSIYNKEFNGRKLIAVRIRDQVFQAMKQLGVKIDYNSIEDMILGNNGTKYMAESEVIQQTILGNCVPFIMNVVTDHNCTKLGELLESMGFHVEALVGNNVILAGENMNEDECRNQIAYESYCKLGFEVDVEVYEMEYIEAKNGFAIKHFKNGNFEMKKVIGNKFLQALAFTQNRRVIEEDLLFMIDEEPAKYVRYCYEGVNREKKWSY